MRWIPVTERLPEESGLYHTKTFENGSSYPSTNLFTLGMWEVEDEDEDEDEDVIEWLDESPVKEISPEGKGTQEIAEELWDSHSTFIGSNISELEDVADRDVMFKRNFLKATQQYAEQLK